MLLTEGIFDATPIHAIIGVNKKSETVIVVRFRIEEGPNAGQEENWTGPINEKSARFTGLGMQALGWNPSEGLDAAPNVIMAAKRRVPVTVKTLDPTSWGGSGNKYSVIDAVGRGAMPQLGKLESFDVRVANQMLMVALKDEAPARAPAARGNVTGRFSAPRDDGRARFDDDIPF